MSRKHVREVTWFCVLCGFRMDAESGLTGDDAIPMDGDLSLCRRCGQVYERRGVRHFTLSLEQIMRLDAVEIAAIDRAQALRLASAPRRRMAN